MLSYIRAFAKSPFATGILGLLIVAFAIFGIGDVFRQGNFQDAVVKAGSRPPITSARFKQMFAADKNQIERRAGQPVSNEDAIAHGFDKQVLSDVTLSESFAAMMGRMGVHPSDELIAGELRKIPAFFSPISGAFDKTAYERALAAQGLTPMQADNDFRDEIAQQHFVAAMAAGLKPPAIYGVVSATYLHQQRNFTWFPLGPQTVGAPIKPTDAQLIAFMKENAAQITKPEMRVLSVVHFSAAAIASTVTINDADVQKRFDFEKDTLSQPEKRSLVQIPVKDAASADAVTQKLRAGADPQAVAKSLGTQPVTYTDTPKSGVADRAVADAAFSLKSGEVSSPIKGDLGMAVVKVGSITPAHSVTLADVKPKVEAEVRKDAAQQKIYDQVQKYSDTQSSGSNMADAAKAVGQPVVTLPPIVAQGVTLEGQPAPIPLKVLQAAFGLAAGADTEVQDLGQGEYWVAHVDKVLAPALPGLDETLRGVPVRALVTKAVVARDLLTRMKAKAQALRDEIAKGKTMQAAAAEIGAVALVATDVERTAGQQVQGGPPPVYSADLLGRVFAAGSGEVVVGQGPQGLIIAKIDRIGEAAPQVLAMAGAPLRSASARDLFQDMAQATRTAARDRIKPHVDVRRARQALGLDADGPPAAPAKP